MINFIIKNPDEKMSEKIRKTASIALKIVGEETSKKFNLLEIKRKKYLEKSLEDINREANLEKIATISALGFFIHYVTLMRSSLNYLFLSPFPPHDFSDAPGSIAIDNKGKILEPKHPIDKLQVLIKILKNKNYSTFKDLNLPKLKENITKKIFNNHYKDRTSNSDFTNKAIKYKNSITNTNTPEYKLINKICKHLKENPPQKLLLTEKYRDVIKLASGSTSYITGLFCGWKSITTIMHYFY
jgi:hypothetical protein